MKNHNTIISAISTLAMALSFSANADKFAPSGGSSAEFTQSCQQERRAATNSCRIEYESAMQRLTKDPSADKNAVFQVEITIRNLCEQEAEREYDYCNISAKFQNTNIIDVLEGDAVVLTYQEEPTSIEDISPYLSGANYRTLAQLCAQMPGYGSGLYNWTGADLYSSCMQNTREACMNDPEMGSNVPGSGSNPYSPNESERARNCANAIEYQDVPVI